MSHFDENNMQTIRLCGSYLREAGARIESAMRELERLSDIPDGELTQTNLVEAGNAVTGFVQARETCETNLQRLQLTALHLVAKEG